MVTLPSFRKMAIDPEFRERLEKLGITNVRSLADQWSGAIQAQAREWLKEKDDENNQRNVEAIELARSANSFARAANKAAEAANSLAASANSLSARALAKATTNNIIAAIATIIAGISLYVSLKH